MAFIVKEVSRKCEKNVISPYVTVDCVGVSLAIEKLGEGFANNGLQYRGRLECGCNVVVNNFVKSVMEEMERNISLLKFVCFYCDFLNAL